MRVNSSSSVHAVFFICGFKWLCHLEKKKVSRFRFIHLQGKETIKRFPSEKKIIKGGSKGSMYCICTGTKARILVYVGCTGLGGL
jgi:hypothetical protein